MKKVFLTVSTVFALSLMFSANYQGNDLVKNSAFADEICCPDLGGLCCYEGSCRTNYSVFQGSSCNKEGKEVLTIAP